MVNSGRAKSSAFLNSFGVFLHFFDFYVAADFFKLNGAKHM